MKLISDYNIFLHENKKGCALFLILEVVGFMRDENKFTIIPWQHSRKEVESDRK